MRNKLLVLLMVFSFEKAFPIGRVGNNGMQAKLVDEVEGFEAQVPNEFSNVFSFSNDRSAKLESNELIESMNETQQLTMMAYPFSKAFPQFVSSQGTELEDFLQSQDHFTLTKVTVGRCSLFLLGENKVGFIGVARWSGGRGYVLTVQKSKSNSGRKAIMKIFETTQVRQSCP